MLLILGLFPISDEQLTKKITMRKLIQLPSIPELQTTKEDGGPDFFKELKQISQDQFPFIYDISKLTDPFRDQHCIITFHNFAVINIPRLELPILLKTPVLVRSSAASGILDLATANIHSR